MSRASQAERAAEREQAALDEDYASGRLSKGEYLDACREMQRDMRDAYEQDMYEAQQAVRDEWGW